MARQTLSALLFKPGTNYTVWEPLQSRFQDSLQVSGVDSIDWESGAIIETRWKISPCAETNGPGKVKLILEAIVLERGQELERLPPEARSVFHGGAAMTFLLFSTELAWYAPSKRSGLFTTPGLYVRDAETSPALSDPVVRLFAYHAPDLARQGGHTDGSDWATYLVAPLKMVVTKKVHYALPIDLQGKNKGEKPKGQLLVII